jgi:16S rRNA processing protein RimM
LKEYLRVGRILKPQGIKVELKVEPLTYDLDRFSLLTDVFIEAKDVYTASKLVSARVREGFVYVFLDKVNDRNAAELLRNCYLCIAREDAMTPPDDTYYIDDLVGCVAYTNEGHTIGELTEVIKTGANDVFILKTPTGDLLVPAIKKVVLSVDTKEKRITLDGKVLKEVSDF